MSVVLATPSPHHPDSLRTANVQGEVLVWFVVDTAGFADMRTFNVIRSTEALFADAVRSVLPVYRFRPAELGGGKVRQLVMQLFLFSVSKSAPDGD